MRIIFTDKLSKIVAQYENLCDMIFDLNTSLDISWDPGEKRIQYHEQDLTLNDFSSQNEVPASRYLTLKNNKITVEEEQQDINFEKFVLMFERKACRKKMVDDIMFIRQTNVHYMVPMFDQLG